MMRRTRSEGFTLIELVVVIAILGILAAFAIPRFIDLNRDARESAVRGLSGSLRSASALVHGMALARNTPSGSSITLEGASVKVVNGYPEASALGIGAALANYDGFVLDTAVAGQARFYPTGYNKPECSATYNEATATAPATVVVPDPLDCR